MSISITICPLHDIDVTAIMAILGSIHTNYTPTITADDLEDLL